MPSRLTLLEFIQRSRMIHGDKYDYSKSVYVSNRTKVIIICPEHGEFKQTPDGHMRGQGCPICRWDKAKKSIRKVQGLTKDMFIKKARMVHGDRYDYSKVEYVNNETKVCIICPEHGEFWQTPHHHTTSKSGCPKCARHDVSEKRLLSVLKENFQNITYQYSPDFLKGVNGKRQSIDIFLPDVNIGIEYQGRQHFMPITKFGGETEFQKTCERDLRKYSICKQNGISILYFTYDTKIPDSYYDKIYQNEDELINAIKKYYD